MTIESLHDFLSNKPGATEDYPFGEDTRVFKVAGKIFAMLAFRAHPPNINLKCDPDRVPEWRGQYPAITDAPYLHKRHWNRVRLDDTVPDDEVLTMCDDSYALVVKGLPKKDRDMLSAA